LANGKLPRLTQTRATLEIQKKKTATVGKVKICFRQKKRGGKKGGG